MSELREALEGAFDEAETDEASAGTEDQVSEDLQTGDELGEEQQPAGVEEEQQTEEQEEPKGDEEQQTEELAESGDQTTEQRADSDVKTEKPPVGWSPQNREHWGKLPQELKVQINKREREVNQLLQNTANERKLAQAFSQTVEPYRAVMASQGVNNPLQAIDELMKTAATLGMGTPQQKAMRIAGLIQHYGVDINTLDGVLAGDPQAQQPDQNQQINQAVNQALAPFMQQQQHAAHQQQQATTQRVQQGIQAIESKEFFEDVRLDMADIMEMASKRGLVVTLDQAYERAVQMNPEISSVLAARQQQESLQGKKQAASGIAGNKSGVQTGQKDMSLADTLAAAWDGNLN